MFVYLIKNKMRARQGARKVLVVFEFESFLSLNFRAVA